MAKGKKNEELVSAEMVVRGDKVVDPLEAPPLEPVVPPAPPEFVPLEAPAAVAKKVDCAVVARTTSISWGGQIIKLHEGDTVSDESYGTGAVQRMRDAGVAMKE